MTRLARPGQRLVQRRPHARRELDLDVAAFAFRLPMHAIERVACLPGRVVIEPCRR